MALNARLLLIAIVSSVLLSGCVNLRAVNDYSNHSVEGLHTIEELGFSFEGFCLHNCELEQMQNAKFVTTLNCDCNTAHVNDSVTMLILNVVRGYFQGMANLSANELITYNTDTLTNAITQGNFGSLRLDHSTTVAFGSITNILLRAFADQYRRKHINRFIEEANQPIQALVRALQQITGTEIKRLYTSLETRYQVFYDQVLLTTSSGYEKAKAVQEYYAQINMLKAKERQIDAISQSLDAIAKGHQLLYDHRNKLTVKDLQQQITLYSSQIGDLISQFHIFKI